jgi:hypothetical protein
MLNFANPLKKSGLSMRKPFDVLAGGLLSKNSRGDKTPLELFLAGLRGLDAEVRQRIGLQEQSA